MSFEFLRKNKTKKRILIAFLLLIATVVCFYLIRRIKAVNDIIEAACILTEDIFYRKSVPNDKSYAEWHTKKYLAAALLEKNDLENISDPDLKNLLTKRSDLPASWLKKIEYSDTSAYSAEQADHKQRWVAFYLIDGDIAWTYLLLYDSDGSLKFLREEKYDAKDYDPKYQDVIQKINQKVKDEMDRENIKGFGSCHYFWDLKKKYLKVEGIDWKSPTELNPNTMYD